MTDREQQLLHLVDRARRGVALPEELDQLATGVGAVDQLRTDLDRVQQAACRTAENLRHAEDRIARAEAAIESVRAVLDEADSEGCHFISAELILAALDAPQQPTTPPVHLAKGTNAEDCPACKGTNPPYPFLCPGPESASPFGDRHGPTPEEARIALGQPTA